MGDTGEEQGVQSTLEYVSPDALEFDAKNPRFAEQLAGKTQDEIQKYIFGEPHFRGARLSAKGLINNNMYN